MRLLTAALAAAAVLGFAVPSVADSPERPELPLTGFTERGQEWRLAASKPLKGDDAPSSWCLKLGYTTGITVNGNRFTGGLRTCGRRPPARVSGFAVIDCERGGVFVTGAARAGARRLRVRDRDGQRVRPQFAQLPPGSGFTGRTFIAVIDVRRLPAELIAARAGKNPIARLPRRRKVCLTRDGEPVGGAPFTSFESTR